MNVSGATGHQFDSNHLFDGVYIAREVQEQCGEVVCELTALI
jgi:hypothetical protein